MTSSASKNFELAVLSLNHEKYLSQTGSEKSNKTKIYIFSNDVSDALDALGKNDFIKVIIKQGNDNSQEGFIPMHNYRRAKSWAYSIQ
mgnify:FL=1